MVDRPEREQGVRHPAAPASGQSPDDRSPGGSLEAEEAAGLGVRRSDAEQNSEAAAQEVERDLDALEETKRERDEYLELAQRTKADFENYRKRVAGEAASAQRRGKAELASELIPVIDNLERALLAAGIDPAAALAGEVSAEGAMEQGVVLTYRDLRETLQRAGVEAFDPRGEKFDPEVHEAISTRPAEEVEPGTVLDVAQKGYRLDGQVLRAARVVVSE
jgi:molecular chaperone GrpE